MGMGMGGYGYFNMRTHNLSTYQPDNGVLVKCRRFIAYKKQINAGGVIPEIPDDKTLELLAGHKQWGEHEEVKLKLLLSQNILEDNFDYGSDESQISASLLDDHDSGSDLETDTNVSDAENRNLANDSHTQSLKEEAKFENLDQLNKDKNNSKPGPSTMKTTKLCQNILEFFFHKELYILN